MLTHKKPNETRSGRMREVRVASGEDGSHAVSGYAILYNSPSVDLGGFTELCAPGCLSRTLTENPDVLCLRDHKEELLLGRTLAGTLVLEDDQQGLRFTCNLPPTTAGNDLAVSLERGDIDTCSFMFTMVNDTWIQDAQGSIVRTLLDIDLHEISVVSFPAYPDTSAALRSAPAEIRSALTVAAATLPPIIPAPEPTPVDAGDAGRYRQHLGLKLRLMSLSQ